MRRRYGEKYRRWGCVNDSKRKKSRNSLRHTTKRMNIRIQSYIPPTCSEWTSVCTRNANKCTKGKYKDEGIRGIRRINCKWKVAETLCVGEDNNNKLTAQYCTRTFLKFSILPEISKLLLLQILWLPLDKTLIATVLILNNLQTKNNFSNSNITSYKVVNRWKSQ